MLDCHIHLGNRALYPRLGAKNMLAMLFKEAFRKSTCWSTVTSSQKFLPMYKPVCMQNDFIDAWLGRKGGKRDLDEFLHLANEVRRAQWPLPIQFGL